MAGAGLEPARSFGATDSEPALGSGDYARVLHFLRRAHGSRARTMPWIPGLLTIEVPEHLKAPGTWMHDALQLRDQWESKLLRSTRWSPLA